MKRLFVLTVFISVFTMLFAQSDDDCLACRGTGKALCYGCSGNGYTVQNVMDLNGYFWPTKVRCSFCNGRGAIKCIGCNGSGISNHNSLKQYNDGMEAAARAGRRFVEKIMNDTKDMTHEEKMAYFDAMDQSQKMQLRQMQQNNSSGRSSTGTSSYGRSGSCPQCYGTGNCSVCYGSGTMDLIYTGNSKTCTICRGKGKCTSCKGTGRR